MGDVNKVMLIGRLGADPEAKQVGDSTVCNLSMATSERWKSKDGQKQERTEWHRVSVWGQAAEFASRYLTKGSLVYVEGRLQTREWTDKDGNRRFTTEVKAFQVSGLGGGKSASDKSPNSGSSGGRGGSGPPPSAPETERWNDPADEDIPF